MDFEVDHNPNGCQVNDNKFRCIAKSIESSWIGVAKSIREQNKKLAIHLVANATGGQCNGWPMQRVANGTGCQCMWLPLRGVANERDWQCMGLLMPRGRPIEGEPNLEAGRTLLQSRGWSKGCQDQ